MLSLSSAIIIVPYYNSLECECDSYHLHVLLTAPHPAHRLHCVRAIHHINSNLHTPPPPSTLNPPTTTLNPYPPPLSHPPPPVTTHPTLPPPLALLSS